MAIPYEWRDIVIDLENDLKALTAERDELQAQVEELEEIEKQIKELERQIEQFARVERTKQKLLLGLCFFVAVVTLALIVAGVAVTHGQRIVLLMALVASLGIIVTTLYVKGMSWLSNKFKFPNRKA